MEQYGYDDGWAAEARRLGANEERVARVVSERRGQWQWQAASRRGQAAASASGRLLRAIAAEESERPAVGDWVVLRPSEARDAPLLVEGSFDDLEEVAAGCRFTDCGHATEPGCAVRQGVERGSLDAARVARWQRLAEEREALGHRAAGRRVWPGTPDVGPLSRQTGRPRRAQGCV